MVIVAGSSSVVVPFALAGFLGRIVGNPSSYQVREGSPVVREEASTQNRLRGSCKTTWECTGHVTKVDPSRVLAPGTGNVDYAGSSAKNAPSLAVALNCGIGSSFLKALVKAFERRPLLVEQSRTGEDFEIFRLHSSCNKGHRERMSNAGTSSRP